jgi:hypothetical protein
MERAHQVEFNSTRPATTPRLKAGGYSVVMQTSSTIVENNALVPHMLLVPLSNWVWNFRERQQSSLRPWSYTEASPDTNDAHASPSISDFSWHADPAQS